ncbi:plasmid transfer protein TraA [Streptomyces sp. FXJ1.172]|uniref:plasmid transfer protein TraA n=1 Tax=Streptomyces sp. FXJ1.172 TaxID=710705 RepID=UPI000ACB11EE|nr:plasmid transfer protein TraA [Streptomyces sp. FXJ1.172]WEO97850.1 plasmid transfer protein TraA [Streptomyces sp. FXJ1.172]
MADNGSANRAANRRYREAQHAGRPLIDGANGSFAKGSVNSKHFGASFAPGFTVNINANKTSNGVPAATSGAGGGGQVLLPAPEFTSPAQVREYCNSLRASAVTLSIEVAMASEILKGVLAAVPDPEGRPFGSRARASKVARKMQKSADALRDAAKNAAACYSTFQQEYEEEINRVRHRARRPQQPVINWAQQ